MHTGIQLGTGQRWLMLREGFGESSAKHLARASGKQEGAKGSLGFSKEMLRLTQPVRGAAQWNYVIFETFSCSGPNLRLYQSSFVDLGWSPGIGFNVTALTTRYISGCGILLCLGASPWTCSTLHSSVVSSGFTLVAVSTQLGVPTAQAPQGAPPTLVAPKRGHREDKILWAVPSATTSPYRDSPLPLEETRTSSQGSHGWSEASSYSPNPKGLWGPNSPCPPPPCLSILGHGPRPVWAPQGHLCLCREHLVLLFMEVTR